MINIIWLFLLSHHIIKQYGRKKVRFMQDLEGMDTVERMLIHKAYARKIPINGSLELLPLCNMNCDMCYIRLSKEEMNQKGRLRTKDEWLALAKQMKDAGTLFLLLTGGEPLLFPEFKQLYKELQNMGMILTINTNGTLLNEEWADFFAKHKPRRVNITLYGADDQAYEKLCHYKGGFDQTIHAIKLLRDRKVDVKINGSITTKNENDIKKILEIAANLDAAVNLDTYMYPAIRERNKPFHEQSRMNPKEAAMARARILKNQWEKEAFESYRRSVIDTVEHYIPENYGYDRHISCLAGNCSFTINWQGMMRPCVMQSVPQVNVFEEEFIKSWEQIVQKTDDILINEACVSCKYRPICNTCAAAALLETGDYEGIPEYICEYTKTFFNILKEGI